MSGADHMEARVPLLAAKEAVDTAVAHGVPDYMAGLSVFRILLHQPDLARAVNDLLATMLWHGRLEPRLRELAIMRIGWCTATDYEWTQHWTVALGLGVEAEELLAVRDWQDSDRFGPVERAVLTATDEVIEAGAVSAATFAACRDALGGDPAVLVELVVAIGTWRMIATFLRSLDVPLEDGIGSWPPDGRAPPAPQTIR